MNKKGPRLLVSFKVDKDVANYFKSCASFNGENMSFIIEKSMIDYVKNNSVSVSDKLINFFDVESVEDGIKKNSKIYSTGHK